MNAAAVEMEEYEGMPGLLRQQVTEKLAAHRMRRAAGLAAGAAVAVAVDGTGSVRSQKIASAVAEHYAQTQSYREFLAFEAEEATRRAHAAAEVAARTAAVASAQRELMEELTAGGGPDVGEAYIAPVPALETRATVSQVSRAGLSVRLFEDTGRLSRDLPPAERVIIAPGWGESEEMRTLEEEISFRQSPTFELEQPSVEIPGNLLEFPRQLVATRKARPRYAEGPLTADGRQDGSQLRIFEVESEQMTAAVPVESAAPEWSSIWLDALAESPVAAPVESVAAVKLAVASVERRVMAAVVDGCLVGIGFVAVATGFAYRAAALPSPGVAAAASVVGLAALFLVYGVMFFTFSEATPGMRYARIGLCTFEDENPTRAAMRKRVFAVLLSACPVGLGFLWAWVDDDRLGWHDRMSRTYQRSY